MIKGRVKYIISTHQLEHLRVCIHSWLCFDMRRGEQLTVTSRWRHDLKVHISASFTLFHPWYLMLNEFLWVFSLVLMLGSDRQV